jgi:hypothetical protein
MQAVPRVKRPSGPGRARIALDELPGQSGPVTVFRVWARHVEKGRGPWSSYVDWPLRLRWVAATCKKREGGCGHILGPVKSGVSRRGGAEKGLFWPAMSICAVAQACFGRLYTAYGAFWAKKSYVRRFAKGMCPFLLYQDIK